MGFDRQKISILPIFLPYQGCPSRCSYCNQEITGQMTMSASDGSIEQMIELLWQSLPPEKKAQKVEIALYGGSLIGPASTSWIWLLRRLQPYIVRGWLNGIRVSTRPDFISRDIIRVLEQHGVTTIELGVPALVQTVLDQAGRGHSVEDVRLACQAIRQSTIELGLQLMFGLPGDTHKTMATTLERACQLRPDFVRIHPTIVLRGTRLADLFVEGDYQPLSLARAVVISGKWLKRFESEGIRVVRMGLQTLDSMTRPDAILAGPFHPAFGELVQAYCRRAELVELLKTASPVAVERLTITVPKHFLSQYLGHHRHNLTWLRHKYPHYTTIRIESANVMTASIKENGTVS
ncbi:radical SAM protein [bacterium]|nr:radical SAM protein [bacterium]